MKYFYSALNDIHDPKYDYSDGLPAFAYMESVPRMKALLDGVLLHVKKEEIVHVKDLIDLDLVYDIHDKDYIDFLRDLCEDLEENEDFIPSIFRSDLVDAPLRFRAGMYCKEIGTPLQKGSFKAALNSANTALRAAKYLHVENKNAFALTRPPGHHSGAKNYGGYGFINNAYLCAKYFLNQGLKPVVLDVDYHIGDGSVELCEGGGVEYFSLHIDPWKNYPYLNKGMSFKENIHLAHLPHKITNERYFEILAGVLEQIKSQNTDVLVLSLGFDTLASDYCQDEQIGLKNEDFLHLGRMIKALDMKLLICLEGGYDTPNLTESMDYFLQGIK